MSDICICTFATRKCKDPGIASVKIALGTLKNHEENIKHNFQDSRVHYTVSTTSVPEWMLFMTETKKKKS